MPKLHAYNANQGTHKSCQEDCSHPLLWDTLLKVWATLWAAQQRTLQNNWMWGEAQTVISPEYKHDLFSFVIVTKQDTSRVTSIQITKPELAWTQLCESHTLRRVWLGSLASWINEPSDEKMMFQCLSDEPAWSAEQGAGTRPSQALILLPIPDLPTRTSRKFPVQLKYCTWNKMSWFQKP